MNFKNSILSVVAGAAMVSLSSCGGGWNDENIKSTKETCTSLMEIAYPEDAKGICDCYVDKLVQKYPKGDFSSEQADALMTECSADAKKKAEEEADRKLQETLDKFNASSDSLMNSMSTEGEKTK
jgi:hypothetical protein